MTETQLRQKYIQGLLALEGKCAEGGANHSALLAVYNTLDPLPRGVVATEAGVYAVSLDGSTAVSGGDEIVSGATYTIINWGG